VTDERNIAETMAGALAAVADVASHLEETFATVGSHLGLGHTLFDELNAGLAALSEELSGAKIAGASAAIEEIANKLTQLVDVLHTEGGLLGAIGASADQASAVLKPLVKHIKMVMIIARNAKIEAATLGSGQDGFLDFTEEAFKLAAAVQASIESCTADQGRLSEAVATALGRQRDFETRYRDRLRSVSAGLITTHSAMASRQEKSVQLARSAGAGTRKMAEAVGTAIVSLQAGDSTRQRLEHVCRALRIASGSDIGIVPAVIGEGDEAASLGRLICGLQAEQLKSAAHDFGGDLGDIDRSLKNLLAGASDVVAHGRQLSGGDGDSTASFLTSVREKLSDASALIGACEASKASVDDALTLVREMLGKFRVAIANLSEAIVDIILIGMNAGLKANQLGVKGRAFVVIANEMRATADRISDGAALLKPILDSIEHATDDLKRASVDSDPAVMANLEPTILHAIQEIETGNNKVLELMTRLTSGGTQFEGLMAGAQTLLATLGEKSGRLPDVARDLDTCAGRSALVASDAEQARIVFDDLYAQYTMTSERDAHVRFARRAGLPEPAVSQAPQAQDDTDDVLFF
jgi:hypothetical protein